MKKILLATTLCTLSAASFANNIGENYEKGGFILGGWGYFSSDEDSKWSRLSGNIAFLPAKGLSLGLSTTRYKESSKITDSFDSNLDLRTFIDYSFGYNPDAETGLAYSLGTSVTFRTYKNEFSDISPSMMGGPYFKVNYYLAPRISVYTQASTYTSFNFNPDITNTEDAIYSSNSISFGINYSFANKDITWNNISK